ncbi:MAG: hypothetical protein ACKOXK_04240 [Chakrabartia sp.]
MRGRPRALDALALTLGLWVCGRLLVHLLPLGDPAHTRHARQAGRPFLATLPPAHKHLSIPPPSLAFHAPNIQEPPPARVKIARTEQVALPYDANVATQPAQMRAFPTPEEEATYRVPPSLPSAPRSPAFIQGSAWAFLRKASGSTPIADHGQLGGSQMGFRLLLPLARIEPGLSASLRFSASPDASSGRELAIGLNMAQPFGLPLSFLMEQRIGERQTGGSRPAFVLLGGLAEKRPLPRLIAEGYGQIGGVGLSHPQAFADARFTLTLQTSALARAPRIGLGLWVAAQPDAARLDIGPSLVLPDERIRITLDWRLRVAGQARPASGPSLTIGKDF